MSLINDIDKFKEKINQLKINDLKKFYEKSDEPLYTESISDIIESFRKVNLYNTEKIYSLSESDLSQLQEFGTLLQKSKEYSKNELKSEGQKLGLIFRSCPSIENLANLISVIISGFVEILKIKPYMIQNLSVASFCPFS